MRLIIWLNLRLAINLVFFANAKEVKRFSGYIVIRLDRNLVNSGDQFMEDQSTEASKRLKATEAEVLGPILKGLRPPVFSSKAVMPKDHQSASKLYPLLSEGEATA